jgi:hypothetical protein
MAKFSIGDIVHIPYNNENYIECKFFTQSNGIPESLISHGSAILHSHHKYGSVVNYHENFPIVEFIDHNRETVRLGFNEKDLTHKSFTIREIFVDCGIGIIYERNKNKEILSFIQEAFPEKANIGMYKYYGYINRDINGRDDPSNFLKILTIDEIKSTFFNNNSISKSNGNNSNNSNSSEVCRPSITIRSRQETIGKVISSKKCRTTIKIGHLSNRTIIG